MLNDDARSRKAQIAHLYNKVATTYGMRGPNLFVPFGRWLVECMQLQAGERVLDVATGRGAVLFAAAEQVGPAGSVVGIDLAEQMIACTAEDIVQCGVQNAHVEQMDAEHLTFPAASFDHVICAYALFFFPNIERVLAEFFRVLRPGGKLGLSVPNTGDERWRWYTDLLEAYQRQYHISLDMGGPFLEDAKIVSLLRQAGFVDIDTRLQEYEFVYARKQDWWLSKWDEASRFPLERMPADVLERFKAQVFKRIDPLKQPDGIHYIRRTRAFLCVRGLPTKQK
ncbi:methyltransferase domain-containing protein [Ktedonosporobacter rubrisoli]|uniref:Methyltransferase domain-containing protein n=1 Tax=Ktedonosporobacter rubrisoli TaxID=2509675 RepID=A0A4P6JJS5_KTERU|nr:methyltransferase domain-containing protein [Ktedonosporobacter rubrisoli]QBD75384.1 methyltransferase domain-containing protein [Ktedonosporobacter rubrisoli]